MRLRTERRQAKLTQTELAREATVTQSTISRIEAGALQHPSFDVLHHLSVELQQRGRQVTAADLQPRPQPLRVKGARTE